MPADLHVLCSVIPSRPQICLCGTSTWSGPIWVHRSTYHVCCACGSWLREDPDADRFQEQQFVTTYPDQEGVHQAQTARALLWTEMWHNIVRAYPNDDSDFPQRMLDFGCGPGDLLDFARHEGCDVWGVELNDCQRKAANQRGLRVVSCLADLPSSLVGQVDLVTCLNVLDYLPDAEAVLSEFLAWLRPGGALVVRIPNGNLHARLLRWTGRVPGLREWYLAHEFTPLHRWLITRKGLADALARGGYETPLGMASGYGHRGVVARVTARFLASSLTVMALEPH